MYELYSVCASLLCETQKDETKQKRWQKHYREDKKPYVGGILITSFKLPVLSCSQLLKITGFKNTIYNVLALDRCSTCVTVLIYETKMVTVNYVFLCAFFFLKSGGEGCRDMAAADARVREKKKNVLFFGGIWRKRKTFPKKKDKKKGEKKKQKSEKMKKYMNIFFFLSNTFQCDLW